MRLCAERKILLYEHSCVIKCEEKSLDSRTILWRSYIVSEQLTFIFTTMLATKDQTKELIARTALTLFVEKGIDGDHHPGYRRRRRDRRRHPVPALSRQRGPGLGAVQHELYRLRPGT